MNLVPTRIEFLAKIAAVSFSSVFIATALWQRWNSSGFSIRGTTAIAMWTVAISLLLWTLNLRTRLKSQSHRPPGLLIARSAALAMASSRVGALILGAYLGLGVFYLMNMRIAINQQRLLISVATVIAAIVTVAVALWLEKLCRIPESKQI